MCKYEEEDRDAKGDLIAEPDRQRIKAGEPRGFELERAGTVYRYRKRQFDDGIHGEQEKMIPSAVDRFLWGQGQIAKY